jgi:hypothetical protein
MEEQDYPIKHFEMMREVATRLALLPAVILEHNYSYKSFGSWWFTFRRSGREFRIVFDGRDDFLYIQDAADGFRDIDYRQLKRPITEIVASETCSLVMQKT